MTPQDLAIYIAVLEDPTQPHVEAKQAIMDAFTKPGGFWPDAVMEAVAEHVSGSVWNPESRTYKGLDKRICHTISVWRNRYGPLSVEQEKYVAELLVAAVTKAASEAGTDKKKLYPFLHSNISYLVNHETVHAGFQKRAAQLVDVTDILSRVAA